MEKNNEKLSQYECELEPVMDIDWLFNNMKHRGRNHNSSN